MHPILNYVEFRTNHEPYMVHGVVDGVPCTRRGAWRISEYQEKVVGAAHCAARFGNLERGCP